MSDKFLRLERWQAEIVPVQKAIFAAKTSAYLMPVVAIFGNETLLCFREVGDSSCILLPTRTWSWLPFFDRGRLYFLGFSFWKKKKVYIYLNRISPMRSKYNSALLHLSWTYHHQKLRKIQLALSHVCKTKSTEILSVSSFCFCRLFPIQKYICNQRLLFTGRYVVF